MTRYRTRSAEPKYMQHVVHIVGDHNYGNYDWTCPAYNIFSREETMTDEVNPGFHGRVANGEVFCNPVNYVSVSEEALEGSAVAHIHRTSDPSWTKTTEGGHYTSRALVVKPVYLEKVNEAPALNLTSMEQSTKQRCLAAVDGTPYEFFEDIAELKETLEFLKNPIASLAGLARAFSLKKRKLNSIKNVKKRLKAIADLWNTYRFAAAPLIRSAMTALEAYNDREKALRPSRRTAHARFRDFGDPFFSQHTAANGISHKYHYNKWSMRSVEAHATIYYEVSNPVDDWFFRLGLRVKDVPVTMWEILPLSFMVDRLINIRAAIAGLLNIADPSVTFLASSYTTRATDEHLLQMYSETWDYGEWTATIENPDFRKYTSYSWKRALWSPSVYDTIPPITPGYLVKDVQSILDLISIITSRVL